MVESLGSIGFICRNPIPEKTIMDSEKVKRFIILYLALIMPALLLLLAAIYSAGILWFLLLFAWIGAGLLLVFLPTIQDRNGS